MSIDIRTQLSQWIGSQYIDDTTRRLLQTAMEEIERLNETIRLQANAARAGMDAAKRQATILYAEADKARTESSPDVLASERQANALLTEENERLQETIKGLERQVAELRGRSDALYAAAIGLRKAQIAYMADRGNEEKGMKVGEWAWKVDEALATIEKAKP